VPQRRAIRAQPDDHRDHCGIHGIVSHPLEDRAPGAKSCKEIKRRFARKSDRPYCSRSEALSFFNAMAAECDLPHSHMASSNGHRDFPRGVISYSTRGGVSAKTVRSTIPVFCKSRSCWESVRCVIPLTARFSSENRLVPWKSCSRTAAFQRPPTIRAVVSTGQTSGRLIICSFILYTTYPIRATYPYVTSLGCRSSILTTANLGPDLEAVPQSSGTTRRSPESKT
jgi:hypothetical protein